MRLTIRIRNRVQKAVETVQKAIVENAVDFAIGTNIVQGTASLTAQQRLDICTSCPSLLGNGKCGICKCFVSAKTKISSQSCPAGKW
jgi:hypothetical protein